MKLPEQYRVTLQNPQYLGMFATPPGSTSGLFLVPKQGDTEPFYTVIISAGMGWEHVSVSISTEKRCPTWEEMCYIKDLFWHKTETVVQYHPSEKNYVNMHPHCLHMWRPTVLPLPEPPSIMVGLKKQL